MGQPTDVLRPGPRRQLKHSKSSKAAVSTVDYGVDWTALWTEGTADLSYVRVMENEDEGVLDVGS